MQKLAVSEHKIVKISKKKGDLEFFLNKMVSKFMKMRSTDPRATVVTYAFFHAFKFPDSMAVHIRYICYNFTISFEFKAIKKAIRHQDLRVKKN